MKRIRLIVFLAFSYLTLGGCATITNGTTQKIPVNTTPHGATAKNQDGVSCITPCDLKLKRKQDHIITISKEGFENQSVTCKHVLISKIAVVGYILIPGGFIGAVVDASNGSLYRLTPDSISLELKPVRAKPGKLGLPVEKLKELADLKNSGTITEEEYDKLFENAAGPIGVGLDGSVRRIYFTLGLYSISFFRKNSSDFMVSPLVY